MHHHRPLAALWSARADPRWNAAGEPVATFRCTLDPAGRPRSHWLGPENPPEFTHDPLTDLARVLASPTPRHLDTSTPSSGWIGYLSYDLGRLIEPTVGPARPDPGAWPLIELHRIESDRGATVSRSSDTPCLQPEKAGRVFAPGAMVSRSTDTPRLHIEEAGPVFTVGNLRSLTPEPHYQSAVARAVEYTHAGDCYQVNLAHRLTAPFQGSARALFARLADSAQPWYGAYIETTDGAARRVIASASPELFLDFDPRTRRVTTRPMKGTRPATADPRELAASEKDRAELNMIIDLMRNDLGRVCEFGSVRVEDERAIERHGGQKEGGGVWQAVGTVSGLLRHGIGIPELLAATFPPGSVTGAPKIRAMQIIDELEPLPRGPYCGAIGWFGDDGRVTLSVAIRTALLRGRPGPDGPDDIQDGTLDYSVGAGIVADSNPASEWRETMDKAGVLLRMFEL